MVVKMRFFLILFVCLVLSSVIISCGVSNKKLDAAEKRLTALQEKGLPDSMLVDAKMFVFNARTANKMGNPAEAKRLYKLLLADLQKKEAWGGSAVEQTKPFVDSMRAIFKQKKKALSGMQLKTADSIINYIDSLASKSWMRQAKENCLLFDTIITALLTDEVNAKKLKSTIVGTWVSERTPEGNRYKARELRSITFGADGKLQITEEFKGQSSDYLKEDWRFVSFGTWDAIGDTALFQIKREKCERQIFWNLDEKKGKKWIKKEKPTYDSTIASGRKDKFMTLSDILSDFKKKK